MTVEKFFDLLLDELRENPGLRGYYKFLNDSSKSNFNFRKQYFTQRLEYISKNITKENSFIWDCGCGYGTTAIFLALNGHTVYGNTVEFYFDQIPARLNYWKKFGDISKLTPDYKNHFDITAQNEYDYVIAQDTLHHLEPIGDALQIINKALNPSGKLIAIEENGTSIFNRLRNYRIRGNKRVIELYDEKQKRTFLLGNENTRPLDKWQGLLNKEGMNVDETSVKYVRLFLPPFYKFISVEKINSIEEKLWKQNSFLKRYFYFGTNFIAEKHK